MPDYLREPEFLLFEGSESSGRAFVLHMVFPRFVLEFGAGASGEVVSADPAPPAILSQLRLAAISFYEREMSSLNAYRVIYPEN
jgi:hypothetical protein